MTKRLIRRLGNYFERATKEHARAVAIMKEAFPLGSEVRWPHGNHLRFARVVEHHGYSLRLKVRGQTGSEYWLDIGPSMIREMEDA